MPTKLFQKGDPKPVGSGRKPGQLNRTTNEMREAIVKGTRAFSKIIKIANGETVVIGRGQNKRTLRPAIADIVAANRVLVQKVLPNLVAQHIDINAEMNHNPAEGAVERLKDRLKVVSGNGRAA
jgi:hypothetical protein